MTRSHATSLQPTLLVAALALALNASAATPAAASAHGDARSMRYAQRLLARHAPHASAARTPAPRANTLPVTSCADDADPGTLRNVLAAAGEGDTVDLSALTCSTITLTQGALDSSVLGDHHLYDVTIQGPGRDKLAIDAGGASQVFVVGGFSSSQGTFTLNDVTVANGSYAGSLAACIEGFGGTVALNRTIVTGCHSSGTYELVFGGAVDVTSLQMTDSIIENSTLTATGAHSTGIGGGAYVTEDATLTRSTVSGNSVSAPYANYDGYASGGGGLYVRGKLTLVDSTITGNSIATTLDGEDANGGGVYVRGLTTISGSTIDGNSADGDGGGLFKAVFSVYGDPPPPQDTKLLVSNSTLSGNSARAGGGIASARPVSLANSTIAFNDASDGGGGLMFRIAGVYDAEGTLDAQSSILASNSAGASATHAADLGADDAATIGGANNLVMAADASLALPADTIALDPQLFPLNDNGGPTRTHALAATSPAIDAGNNAAALEFDQRGTHFARVAGAAADIGAFEMQRPAGDDDVIFKDGFDGAASPGTPVEYSLDDGDGDANIGPPSTFSPDMLWGNYFTAQPGGQFITKISVAFGPTFPSLSANNPVTFWLLEDEDGDGDPRNAYAIASVQGVPDVFNDNFFSVDIPPTWVDHGFFVGASAKLAGGQDRPARIDGDGPPTAAWFFYAPDIAATIDNLAAAPYGTPVSSAGLFTPGVFMIRASGQDAP